MAHCTPWALCRLTPHWNGRSVKTSGALENYGAELNTDISNRRVIVLKVAFWTGAVADAVISIEWFLISLGLIDLPIHPSIFIGSGEDFRFVLSIAALFMMGWALLLYWGRMLFVAILSDGLVFGHLFTTGQIVAGTAVKLSLVILFAGSYWYSKRVHSTQPRKQP